MVESKTGSRLINNREIFIVRPLWRTFHPACFNSSNRERTHPIRFFRLIRVRTRSVSLERGIVKRSVSFLAINENGEINRGFQNIGE